MISKTSKYTTAEGLHGCRIAETKSNVSVCDVYAQSIAFNCMLGRLLEVVFQKVHGELDCCKMISLLGNFCASLCVSYFQ